MYVDQSSFGHRQICKMGFLIKNFPNSSHFLKRLRSNVSIGKNL
jgi:hypothetical protein